MIRRPSSWTRLACPRFEWAPGHTIETAWEALPSCTAQGELQLFDSLMSDSSRQVDGVFQVFLGQGSWGRSCDFGTKASNPQRFR